jgi:hypothetical protein
MDDAIKKVRQLAASALVRKERLEEELARILADLKRRGGDPDLDASVASKRNEIADANEAYQQILGDARAVQDAAKEHERLVERAPVDAVRNADPFSMSAEDVALDNVRRHIEQLEAEASLTQDDGPKEDPEAKARAQLAELKAKKGKPKRTM